MANVRCRTLRRLFALGAFPDSMESPFRRAIRAMRSALVYGRLPNGPTFVFPIVQLATSLRSKFSARAFSCRNMIGKLPSAGEWKGWHSPSVSRHRMLSFTLNVSVPGARWIGVSSRFMHQPHDPTANAPISGCVARRFTGLLVTATSVTPRARMGAPKINHVCQSLGLAAIIANTATTMERPIKSPATKLPASRNALRNLAGGFFTIRSDRGNDVRDPEGRRCVSALTAKEVPQQPFVYVSSSIAFLTALSTSCRSATVVPMMVSHCRRT